ncbi:hypothetical protein GOP47_0023040 [Adiantum capillus-veneris]|uniref:mitogen-activated protein kinase kinase n=1 Tax=Adiantum capillus-veneris TaxID=13818 RepID=A0A9D4Z7G4_ADICA|nr:hypothetical protein GOP47_0023040 [Adiantum capillus-veneris]
MSLLEKRSKHGLKSPLVTDRNDSFRSKQEREQQDQQQRKLQKPAPLPLPAPLPRPSALSEGSGRPRSRAAVNAAAAAAGPQNPRVSLSSDKGRTGRQLLNNGSSSLHIEEVNPDDTVKVRLLGHGSSGKVYKVQHKRTNRLYALKIIQDKHEAAVCKQILTEMDILRRAQNPYVVQCFGASEKGGEISFVLEYMDGGSLADVIEAKKTLSERYLAEVAKKALKGLDYLHRNRIVHRDIKPSNILLGRNQEVKIADFGVSTILASTLAPCNTFVGTCAYMSPERFDPDSHGGNYNGYTADIWSLGLSLLECAIGRFPFLLPGEKADWPTLMFAICYNPPPSPPENASPEFKDFVQQCLQKDPSQRPRASTLLTHPFITKFEAPPSGVKAQTHSQLQSGGRFWGNFTKAFNAMFS